MCPGQNSAWEEDGDGMAQSIAPLPLFLFGLIFGLVPDAPTTIPTNNIPREKRRRQMREMERRSSSAISKPFVDVLFSPFSPPSFSPLPLDKLPPLDTRFGPPKEKEKKGAKLIFTERVSLPPSFTPSYISFFLPTPPPPLE